MSRPPTFLFALAAGAASVFAFAPFGGAFLAPAMLGLLFLLWQHAATPREAARNGWAYGLGLFGAGASWVFIALENFGGMPLPVALVATFAFIAYLAAWPAAVGWVAVRFTRPGTPQRLMIAAATWVVAEWLRGTGYTAFPWLTLGYSQHSASPLSGFAPIGGVWLVSFAVALAAAALAWLIDALAEATGRRSAAAVASIAALLIAGALCGRIEWTHAQGDPVGVSLVQGNVAQDTKFDPAHRERILQLYAYLAERARGRLTVLPESALPMFADDVPPEVFARLERTGRARGGDVITGLFILEPPLPGNDEVRIYNSVASFGTAPTQVYRKHHLVPFGESIPLKAVLGWFIRGVLSIPLADQASGPADPPPFDVAGQKVAVNICYEDAFGGELRAAARAATLLVNVTNDAWYGRSIAAWQHNQIAAMRARESGRPMLRATNTGITSVIGHDGREVGHLPWYTRGILEVDIAGRQGDTPYLRFGDAPALILALLAIAAAIIVQRRRETR